MQSERKEKVLDVHRLPKLKRTLPRTIGDAINMEKKAFEDSVLAELDDEGKQQDTNVAERNAH